MSPASDPAAVPAAVLPETAGRAPRRGRPALVVAVVAVVTVIFCILGLGAAASGADVTFHGEVLPILRKKCIGCHGGERPKGGLSLETLESALAGGDEGPPLVAGDPSRSLLFRLVTGAEKPIMPPKGKGVLEPAEIEAIRAWIQGGLAAGEAAREPAPYSAARQAPEYPRPPIVRALSHSRDGGRLFVAAFGEIVVHDLTAVERLGRALPAARLVGESEQINALELSPDGKLLAAVGGNPARFGEVQIWNTETGALSRWLRLGQDTLYAAAFSADGARLAVSGTDRAIHLLDVESGAILYSSEIHADWVFGLSFDGDRIVSGSRDKTIKVSTAENGKLEGNLDDQGGQVLRVRPRPGSRQVLAAGESRVPILYDVAEMKEARKFEAQPGAVLAAAFSADGKLVAVGGAGDEVRIYQVDDGKRKLAVPAPARWTYALSFAPDGSHLAAGGYDGRVRLFRVDDGREIAAFVPVPIGRARRF